MRPELRHPLHHTRRHASLARSIRLLRSFGYEQTQPRKFYEPLARDTARQLAAIHRDVHGTGLDKLSVLDVGGGPGYFSQAFAEHGAHYIGLEPDVSEMTAAGITLDTAVRASGTALPFRDNSVDIVYSSNVAEHIARPWEMAEEMVRVARNLAVISYTVWLGPFGGHETGLWPHYIGGDFARRRYERKHGHPPKNIWGHSLFDVSAREGLGWAAECGYRTYCFPRYHPSWAWWITRIAGLRELGTSNLVIVVDKTRDVDKIRAQATTKRC